MIRSALALAAGYLSISFLEGFVRLIIGVYNEGNFVLAGVAGFASPLPGYLVTLSGILFGLVGGLLTCSITHRKPDTEIVSLIILIAGAGFFSYYLGNRAEPIWYFIGSPFLKIAGVYLGYTLFSKQHLSVDSKTA